MGPDNISNKLPIHHSAPSSPSRPEYASSRRFPNELHQHPQSSSTLKVPQPTLGQPGERKNVLVPCRDRNVTQVTLNPPAAVLGGCKRSSEAFRVQRQQGCHLLGHACSPAPHPRGFPRAFHHHFQAAVAAVGWSPHGSAQGRILPHGDTCKSQGAACSSLMVSEAHGAGDRHGMGCCGAGSLRSLKADGKVTRRLGMTEKNRFHGKCKPNPADKHTRTSEHRVLVCHKAW